jgi:hypothetical protein
MRAHHLKALARRLAEIWIRREYGEPCPDYHCHCVVCRRWKAFNTLFEEDLDADRP